MSKHQTLKLKPVHFKYDPVTKKPRITDYEWTIDDILSDSKKKSNSQHKHEQDFEQIKADIEKKKIQFENSLSHEYKERESVIDASLEFYLHKWDECAEIYQKCLKKFDFLNLSDEERDFFDKVKSIESLLAHKVKRKFFPTDSKTKYSRKKITERMVWIQKQSENMLPN